MTESKYNGCINCVYAPLPHSKPPCNACMRIVDHPSWKKNVEKEVGIADCLTCEYRALSSDCLPCASCSPQGSKWSGPAMKYYGEKPFVACMEILPTKKRGGKCLEAIKDMDKKWAASIASDILNAIDKGEAGMWRVHKAGARDILVFCCAAPNSEVWKDYVNEVERLISSGAMEKMGLACKGSSDGKKKRALIPVKKLLH